MILIISDNNDISTTEVIKWLLVMEKKFIRVHEDEIFEIKIRNKNIFLDIIGFVLMAKIKIIKTELLLLL